VSLKRQSWERLRNAIAATPSNAANVSPRGAISRSYRRGRFQLVLEQQDDGEDVELFVLGLRGWRSVGSGMASDGGQVWWRRHASLGTGMREVGVGVAFFRAEEGDRALVIGDGLTHSEEPVDDSRRVVFVNWQAPRNWRPSIVSHISGPVGQIRKTGGC
jgi:hypothetical protein